MRFMHMADIHLGCEPDQGHPWSRQRKKEIWDTFRRCMEDAGREKVDLLLISGDLFHTQPSLQELQEVNYLFSNLQHTRVVLIAGNHDYLREDSPYLHYSWSRNVVWLFSTSCECVRFPEIRTEVYGFSYDRREITEPLLDHLHPADGNFCHILMAHAGDASHIPVSRETLEQSGFDYIALGHIHRPGMPVKNKAVYPGCPEPLERGDTGEHGYILGEVHRHHVSLTFVPKACRQYRQLQIGCTQEDTTYSLQDRIREMIGETGDQNIYQIVLTGSRQPGMRFDTDRLMNEGKILEIEDRTRAALDLEELKRQYSGSLIGEYISSFDRCEQNETEEKALLYGLEALLENRMQAKRGRSLPNNKPGTEYRTENKAGDRIHNRIGQKK